MEDKVICCCFNVKESDVKKAIDNGVKTFKELQELTSMGTECPPCTKASEEYFNKVIKTTR